MKTVHLVLQGKGGVGKSLVSSILCQYMLQHSKVLAIDTDPVNHTLAGYKKLGATILEIRQRDSIDPRAFDQLMEMVGDEQMDENHQIIIDNGASTFMPLCAWMIENQTLDMWRDEYGLQVLLHCVVTGGQAMKDTIGGLHSLTNYFSAPVVVWLNNFFGEISNKSMGQNSFKDFDIYQQNRSKIEALIDIPLKTAQTFGRDLEELFARKQTFAEAAEDSSLPIMTRHRLKLWWREVCVEIDKARLV